MQKITGRLHSIETFGALDGPGIRYVAFLQGCSLQCAYCHNPDTWNPVDGRMITAEELMADILRYKNFIASGGVTLSGGEPLLQPEFCRRVLELCRENGLHTAIDTSGAVPLQTALPAIALADLLLLDIKALEPKLCKELTGQDNRCALETLNYCELSGKPVWIRHVMVPGVTLTRERLEALAEFLAGYSCIARVELLPFHKMGAYKWETLGRDFTLKDTPEPTEEEIAMARDIFIRHGLPL